MTEQRKEYQRKWAKDHPEKVKEYRRTSARRKALAEILAERQKQTEIGKEVTA